MRKVVVADTSCLIALTNIEALHLLHHLYGKILTTPDVASEFGNDLPEWIEITSPIDAEKQQMLEFHVDRGEASAIVLALEQKANLIILDDLKARKSAESLGLEITGTLGVIIKAKQMGKIDSIKPILNKLQSTNFRISEELIVEACRVAGET